MRALLLDLSRHPGLRRPVAAGGVLCLLAYWAAIAAGSEARLFTHWLYLVVLAVPAALVVVRAVLVEGERMAWALMGAGLTLWTLGSVWQVQLDLRGVAQGFPSFADALWLSMYPFTLAGFALLARTRLGRQPLGMALDALMVTLVLSGVVTALVLPHVSANLGALGAAAQTVVFAYPVADITLASIAVAGLVVSGWRAGTIWILFALGAVAVGAADAVWAVRAAAGTWEPTMGTNAVFPLWPTAIALAAWLPARRQCRAADGDSDVRVLGSVLLAVTAALVLLVANEWAHVPPASIVFAALGLLAALHRTAAAFSSGVRSSRDAARRRALVDDVRDALEERELQLHFQPLVDAHTSAVRGAEALLRWPRDGGFLPPDRFLPVIERTSVIGPLTDYVIDGALAALARWRADGHDLGVSVNLAAANLADDGLPARVAAALERHAIAPASLTLELTETAAIGDDTTAQRVLEALAALGVELSVDDFGTGHSSLTRLAHFPFDELKIDRSFVAELHTARRPIVATAIQLAHTLNLRVVAEGIEDAATLSALRAMGCDVAQGYFVSRPLPACELATWLAEHVAAGPLLRARS